MSTQPLRAIAKQAGLKRYTPEQPCSKGHVCDRYVCDNQCVECCRIKLLERYRKNPDKEKQRSKEYRLSNIEVVREKNRLALKTRRLTKPDVVRAWEKKKYEKMRSDPVKLEKEQARQRTKQSKAYAKNPEKHKIKSKIYRTATEERIESARQKCREYKKKNPDVIRELNFKHNAKDRAARLNRVPKWLSDDDLKMIREIYDEAREKGMQVDHIIPLQGKNVSGLHVPSNLQLLTRSENASKRNFYEII